MNKRLLATIVPALAVCAGIFGLGGCSKDALNGVSQEDTIAERKDIVLTKQHEEIISKGNSFTFDFLSEICSREPDNEIFVSPFSLDVALSMLSNGAKGNTYTQIASVLGYEGLSKNDINSSYRSLIAAMLSADSSTKFTIANALWLNKGFPVLPSFASTLSENYNATVDNLDFSSQKALETVNNWADKNTNGMIPTIFEKLNPDWVYILANALYFKGIWATKFKTDNTYQEDFHCLSGNSVKVDFMHGEIHSGYAYDKDLGATLCELPFGNKAFRLDILLPDSEIDFNSFVQSLTAEKWNKITEKIYDMQQFVIIPKMDVAFSAKESIKETLIALGMEDAFDTRANFSALSEEPTYVSDIIQKTRFKMDESGAEAAAVTVVTGKKYDAGPAQEFFADHPFVYAIREYSTGAILFIGACKNLK